MHRNLIHHGCSSPAWWFLRGAPTRSHSEHGRENPQRQWYFVSRRGRVGRCQACQEHPILDLLSRLRPSGPNRETRRNDDPPRRLTPEGRSVFGDLLPIETFRRLDRRDEDKRQASRTPRHPRDRPTPHAGWSSPVARQAHNLKVVSSNLAPATNKINDLALIIPSKMC